MFLRNCKRRNFFASAKTLEYKTLFKELGLSDHNPGVYDGKWQHGQGSTAISINPATNEILATTSNVS